MINPSPKLYFYIPSSELIDSIPAGIPEYWRWINDFISHTPAKLPDGGAPCTWLGPYNWTVQTFLYLRAFCFPCLLTASLPDEGIIIAHSDFLPVFLKPSSKQFIVEIKPDRFLRCKFANYVISQNWRDPIHAGLDGVLIKSAVVRYWPQPGLIPRNPRRGDRFENLYFMGNRDQFIDEVDMLELGIKRLGLNWKMMPRERWHDYSNADAIVAVRPLVNYQDVAAFFSPERKPASKLCNAWLAGVPAILSPEVAFQDIRRSELDYLEARNVPEIIQKIQDLMGNLHLRRSMVENGKKRASEFKWETIVRAWIEIFQKEIIPEYNIWCKSGFRRSCVYFSRTLRRDRRARSN